MKKLINKELLSSLVGIFLFCLLLRLSTINQIGRTWDEPEYVEQGYKMVELLKKGDFTNSYFYITYDHPPLVKYIYGLVAHFDVEKILPNGKVIFYYDLTHARIFSAFMFSLGVVITVLLGWRFFSPVVGIISGVILAMLPFSLGLSQLVTTESFKIFIYPLAIYAYLLFLQEYSLKKLFFVGIILGISLQIKQSNALLLPLFASIAFLQFRQMKKKEKKGFLKKTILNLFVIAYVSVIIFFIIWPQAIFHLSDIYAIHSKLWHVKFSPSIWQLTISVPEVFLGRLMLTPTFYYFLYFFISIPIFILLLFFIGFKVIQEKKKPIFYALLVWFLLPFALSFYSWRQHGLRYVIEIYPAIALIAALGYEKFISQWVKKDRIKLFCFVPVILYLFIILWQIKPYYLDYFNELVGGTNTVYRHRWFQQGWWGQGLREAGVYLEKKAPKNASIGLAISPDHVYPYSNKLSYEHWTKEKKYDYVVVNYYNIIREGFNDTRIKRDYKLVYQVKADQATLVFVYKHK